MFLQRASAAGAGMLFAPVVGDRADRGARPPARPARRAPIRKIVISCQENRSFDSYFGFAPEVQRRGFGPPPGSSPTRRVRRPAPGVPRTALRSADPGRSSWAASHVQCDGGRIDGFFKSSGNAALGFYTADELPFYYSLFDASDAALCAGYFCSMVGSSTPNHLYMMSATSGGITRNGICCLGILDSAQWPIILDLLDDAGVSWKIYNLVGIDDILHGRDRQRGHVLEPMGARPAHVRHAAGLPAGLRGRRAARRLVGHPELQGPPGRARA